jgi:phage shock protein C
MKKLYRSQTNKKIAGICGGIGEMTNTDPTLIRLITIVLGLVTGFFPFFIGYILAWWIVPEGQNTQQGN